MKKIPFINPLAKKRYNGMVKIKPNTSIKLEWDIYRGMTDEKEDFSHASYMLEVFGEHGKIAVECMAVHGKVIATLPPLMHQGLYGLRLIWFKRFCMWDRSFALKQDAFLVTSDAQEVSGDAALRIKSNVATYGYDGLDAWELSVLYGKTMLSEEEWLDKLNKVVNGEYAPVQPDEPDNPSDGEQETPEDPQSTYEYELGDIICSKYTFPVEGGMYALSCIGTTKEYKNGELVDTKSEQINVFKLEEPVEGVVISGTNIVLNTNETIYVKYIDVYCEWKGKKSTIRMMQDAKGEEGELTIEYATGALLGLPDKLPAEGGTYTLSAQTTVKYYKETATGKQLVETKVEDVRNFYISNSVTWATIINGVLTVRANEGTTRTLKIGYGAGDVKEVNVTQGTLEANMNDPWKMGDLTEMPSVIPVGGGEYLLHAAATQKRWHVYDDGTKTLIMTATKQAQSYEVVAGQHARIEKRGNSTYYLVVDAHTATTANNISIKYTLDVDGQHLEKTETFKQAAVEGYQVWKGTGESYADVVLKMNNVLSPSLYNIGDEIRIQSTSSDGVFVHFVAWKTADNLKLSAWKDVDGDDIKWDITTHTEGEYTIATLDKSGKYAISNTSRIVLSK